MGGAGLFAEALLMRSLSLWEQGSQARQGLGWARVRASRLAGRAAGLGPILSTHLARILRLEPPDPHAADHEAAGAVAGERVVAVGYYGLPALKRPHWRWQIPLYFFLSGLAAAAYLLAALADLFGADEDRPVVSTGRWLALIALLPCPLLLVDDLQRPERFLHMLRIVKPRSPMSVGSWGLALFGGLAGGSALLELVGAPR